MTSGRVDNEDIWRVLCINPEPWAIGPLSIGRKKSGVFPRIGPNQQLVTFQQAVREELAGITMVEYEMVELDFYFWRQLESYKVGNRTVVKKAADVTNLQKATEDALQGLAIANDRNVKRISSHLVAQGQDVEPRIIIRIKEYQGLDPQEIPDAVWAIFDLGAEVAEQPLSWGDPMSDPLEDIKNFMQQSRANKWLTETPQLPFTEKLF